MRGDPAEEGAGTGQVTGSLIEVGRAFTAADGAPRPAIGDGAALEHFDGLRSLPRRPRAGATIRPR